MKIAKLNQPVHFKNVLTSEWKLEICYIGGDFLLFHSKQKAMDFFKINKD